VSIQPIDLQVLFARLNLIGREQAAQRDSITQAQAVAANEIAERSEEGDRRVSELSTEEEGPESVSDETESQSRQREETGKREGESEPAEPEVLQDPDLGQNIDISG
jgi:hypothetical protein